MRGSKLILALLAGSISLHGQQTESLLIRPGDLVHVTVLEAPELEEHVRVSDSGSIRLPLVGDIAVAGLAPREADLAVETALRGHYILDPHVSVLVEQFVTENVTVIGQVKSPGSFPILTSRNILDVLALAGGVTDVADHHLVIQRKDTGERVDYVLSNDPQQALQSMIQVHPGDTVFVPHAEIVYILGDVNRPGGFAKTTNDSKLSVLQAVAMAGGTPPTAVPSHARLIRKQPDGGYANLALPLSDMQKGRKPDLPLQEGDILYVPFSYLRNAATTIGGVLASATAAAIYQF